VTAPNDERREPHSGESGFSLIEVMVSMFLLALLAVAFLPLLVTGMKTTARNATIATASGLVSAQLEQVRTLASTCAAVGAFDDTTVATVTDERGTVFHPRRAVAACPSTYPGTVRVRAWVTENTGSTVLAQAVTYVYLEKAS